MVKTHHTPTISSVALVSGRYLVTDERTGLVKEMTRHQLADYVRANARSPEHIPLGDYLHEGLKRVGFSGCLSCAERQAKLNRMVRRGKRR